MATPQQPISSTPSTPPSTQPHATPPPRTPAPGGVGDAPSTITPPQTPEVGYIQKGLTAIKNFFVWLFKKICCCCNKEKEKPAQTEKEQEQKVQQKEKTQQKEQTQQYTPQQIACQKFISQWLTMSSADMVGVFNKMFPEPTEKGQSSERSQIYHDLGVASGGKGYLETTYEAAGKRLVAHKPEVLLPYLLRRILTQQQEKSSSQEA